MGIGSRYVGVLFFEMIHIVYKANLTLGEINTIKSGQNNTIKVRRLLLFYKLQTDFKERTIEKSHTKYKTLT